MTVTVGRTAATSAAISAGICSSSGNLLVASLAKERIEVLNADGYFEQALVLWNVGNPCDILLEDNDVYVTDFKNRVVLQYRLHRE
jgi:hypothetical protein